MCSVQALGLRGRVTASSSSSGIFFHRRSSALAPRDLPGRAPRSRHSGARVGHNSDPPRWRGCRRPRRDRSRAAAAASRPRPRRSRPRTARTARPPRGRDPSVAAQTVGQHERRDPTLVLAQPAAGAVLAQVQPERQHRPQPQRDGRDADPARGQQVDHDRRDGRAECDRPGSAAVARAGATRQAAISQLTPRISHRGNRSRLEGIQHPERPAPRPSPPRPRRSASQVRRGGVVVLVLVLIRPARRELGPRARGHRARSVPDPDDRLRVRTATAGPSRFHRPRTRAASRASKAQKPAVAQTSRNRLCGSRISSLDCGSL